jgi:hypothetical protein
MAKAEKLKAKIKKKFGSISAFARVAGMKEAVVHKTLTAVEDRKSKKNKLPVISAYNELIGLFDSIPAPKVEGEAISDHDRNIIINHFVTNRINVGEFAHNHGISKSFIYSVINKSATEVTKTFRKLLEIIEES